MHILHCSGAGKSGHHISMAPYATSITKCALDWHKVDGAGVRGYNEPTEEYRDHLRDLG